MASVAGVAGVAGVAEDQAFCENPACKERLAVNPDFILMGDMPLAITDIRILRG